MEKNHKVDILKMKSNQSGSIHLILSMLQHLPTDRPSCSAILSHHFFWSPKKTFIFIADICSILESDFKDKPDCLHFKYESSEITFCQREWMMKLDSEVEDFIYSIRPLYNEDDCPVYSLLKTINYIHKNKYLSPGVLKTVGKSSSDKCMYWLAKDRFPYLLTLVWINCCTIDESRIREKYYSLASDFAKIHSDIAVLTPTKFIIKIKVPNNIYG